jgi:hypothetical protein
LNYLEKETRMRDRKRPNLAWVAAAALVVLGVAGDPGTVQAAGAGYNILQCHTYWRDANEMRLAGDGNYFAQDQCQSAAAQLSITNVGPTNRNQGIQFMLIAPSGTAISEIHLDANLRRGSHHLAQIGVWNGSDVQVLANGPDTNPTWAHYDWGGLNHPQLVIRLYCNDGICPADTTAHVYVRNIEVRLTDWSDPSAPAVRGNLVSGGWQRGQQDFSASASDAGGGISALSVYVNGIGVGQAGGCNTGGLGWPATGYLVPCSPHAVFNGVLNTGAAPFRNGANTIGVGISDYGGNYSPGWTGTVKVDNANPSIAFANSQDPNDPDLVRAPVSDEHSGVASAKLYMRRAGASDWTPLETKAEAGEARARVDSAALPAGEYDFRAVATDVAGNSVETTTRANGEPMKLVFPLREPVDLQAHLNNGASKGQTVRYGTDVQAQGRLLDSQGNPLADREITVVENFGDGALIRERVSKAITDESGHWSSKVPAGPNRSVAATFGGTPRYSAEQKGVGNLVVRSRVRFKTSRKSITEGDAIAFLGKVGHFGARIPAGGKLLELQVRMAKRQWETIGQAFRTEPNGTYRRRYRFGNHYTQDALFHFRVKLKNEANWPFRKAVSKQRKVIVRAR